jgi:hypothetical protein
MHEQNEESKKSKMMNLFQNIAEENEEWLNDFFKKYVNKLYLQATRGMREGLWIGIRRLTNSSGDEIRTIEHNQQVVLSGVLAWRNPDAPNAAPDGIGGAKVNIQESLDGNTWNTVQTATTETRTDVSEGEVGNGFFLVNWGSSGPGVFYFRATYDGDNQYAPAVSNVVRLTVT